MQHIIFIVGPWRSGKTTCASLIQEKSCYKTIDVDEIAKNILRQENKLCQKFWESDAWKGGDLWERTFDTLLNMVSDSNENLIISHSFTSTSTGFRKIVDFIVKNGSKYRMDILECKNLFFRSTKENPDLKGKFD